MDQEFIVTKGWKISGYIFCMVIIAIPVYFLTTAILSGKDMLLWAILSLVFTVFFGYAIIAMYRSKITLTNDEIIQYGFFGEKRFFFNEIKGIRIFNDKIFVESIQSGKSTMILGDFAYTKNGAQLADFLINKFKNLDQVDYDTELNEVLHNPAIGTGIEDREQRLKDVKKISRILNTVGILIGLWVWIYPFPYLLSITIALLYPLIAMIYFFRHQEVLTLINGERKSVYPSLATSLLLPSTGLLIRTIYQYAVQYNLLNFKDCFLPIMVSSVVLTLIFVLFIRGPKTKSNNFWMGVFFSLIYSIGGILIANCAFDRSTPTGYKTRILDQYSINGKSTTYYLKLDAWGPEKIAENEPVPRSVYNQVKKGDVVTVYVKKGYLHIPWYFVE